jgi:hypothetical protein
MGGKNTVGRAALIAIVVAGCAPSIAERQRREAYERCFYAISFFLREEDVGARFRAVAMLESREDAPDEIEGDLRRQACERGGGAILLVGQRQELVTRRNKRIALSNAFGAMGASQSGQTFVPQDTREMATITVTQAYLIQIAP